jgi:hypothetical protein
MSACRSEVLGPKVEYEHMSRAKSFQWPERAMRMLFIDSRRAVTRFRERGTFKNSATGLLVLCLMMVLGCRPHDADLTQDGCLGFQWGTTEAKIRNRISLGAALPGWEYVTACRLTAATKAYSGGTLVFDKGALVAGAFEFHSDNWPTIRQSLIHAFGSPTSDHSRVVWIDESRSATVPDEELSWTSGATFVHARRFCESPSSRVGDVVVAHGMPLDRASRLTTAARLVAAAGAYGREIYMKEVLGTQSTNR